LNLEVLSGTRKALADYDKDLVDFSKGKHLNDDPDFLQIFGDHIIATQRTSCFGSASDQLGSFLLGYCNLSRKVLIPIPQSRSFGVTVGPNSYSSAPNGGVYVRSKGAFSDSVVVLIFKDVRQVKPSSPANKEYQILGDMLAAAFHNNTLLQEPISQTVFAIRIKGSSFVFYRMDVPLEYLKSLGGTPVCDLVVFRCGGDHAQEGFDIAKPGEMRKRVILCISNILAYCASELIPGHDEGKTPEETQKRINMLYE